MNDEQQAILKKYEELKIQISSLEDECEELKPQLLEIVPDEEKVDTGVGVFSKSSRKKWVYSENTQAMEQELKAQQKEEQQTGVASYEEGSPFITYKQKNKPKKL